jgi:hypothetical protein
MIEFILAVLYLFGFILMICIPCFLLGLGLDYAFNGKKNFTKEGIIHHIIVFAGGLIVGAVLLVGLSEIKSWFTNRKD